MSSYRPATSARIAETLAVAAMVVLAVFGATACATHYDGPNRLGVLPPPQPKPLWLGTVRPVTAGSSFGGAAAVTRSTTPHWSHVLVSISGAHPSAVYHWRLQSGSCTSSGSPVSTDDRYSVLVPFPDGTATAESSIPQTLSPAAPYSIAVIAPSQAGALAACADLAYGSM